MKRIIWLALLSFMLVGCASLAPKPPAEPPQTSVTPVSDYFPAKPGSVWEYDGEGIEFARFTRKVTHAAGDKAQVEDESGALVASVVRISDSEVRVVAKEVEMEGEYNLLDREETLDEPILRSPLEVGNRWQSGEATYAIQEIGAQVTVPAGTYEEVIKLKITRPDSDWVTIESYAPGVGLIMRESGNADLTVTSWLESYAPGN